MNNTRIDIFKSSIGATLGLMCFATGIYFVIQANIGVAPWDVFCIGLANTTGILYGTASIIISCSIICIDLILGEKIGIGTVLDAIVVGKTVDLLNYIGILGTEHSLPVSLLMLLIGFILEGFSQFLYMRVGLCCGPRDALQIALGRRVPKVPIGVVNIFLLAAALTVGFFLGGPIGIGTLIAPFGIGIFQQLVFNLVKFEPKDVEHQSIIASFMILLKKNN